MMLQTETILMQSEQTFLAKTRDRSSWSRRSAKSVYLFCKKAKIGSAATAFLSKYMGSIS